MLTFKNLPLQPQIDIRSLKTYTALILWKSSWHENNIFIKVIILTVMPAICLWTHTKMIGSTFTSKFLPGINPEVKMHNTATAQLNLISWTNWNIPFHIPEIILHRYKKKFIYNHITLTAFIWFLITQHLGSLFSYTNTYKRQHLLQHLCRLQNSN